MKARNLVLGMVLAANVLTAQGDVFTTAAITAAITTANTVMIASANNARSSEKTGEKKMKTFDKKDSYIAKQEQRK